MGFEDQIDFERRQDIFPPHMKTAYEMATKLAEENAVNPANFKGLFEYRLDNIDQDLEEIEKLKKKFETNDVKKVADTLEGLIYQHAEVSDWFGPNAETIKTSEYDDIKNKTDLIVEFTEDSEEEDNQTKSHLALAIDVTFGSNIVQDKLKRIKDRIDAGELRDIKYFETENKKNGLKERHRLSQIPHVVIGIEPNTISDLSAAWVRGDNKFIGESEAQYSLLEEMHVQLKTFAEYAKQKGKDEIADKYNKALEILEKIQETKNIPKGPSDWREDRVLKGIRRGLKNLFNLTEEAEQEAA